MDTTTSTSTSPDRGWHPLGPPPRVAPTAALGMILAGGAAALALRMGPGADYSAIFPPVWTGLVGAGLLGIAVLLVLLGSGAAGRWAQGTAWTAAVVLLGASGGVLLDGFRAFFAVTGIPAGDFSEVDVPGAIARACALVASFSAVQFARRMRVRARSTLAAASGRGRLIVGLLGMLLCLPYPLLKLVWWMQGADGSFAVGFPGMELAAFAAAAVVLLGLTLTRTPDEARAPLLVAGWVGAFALLSMGALMVFGVLAQVTGLAASPLTFGDPGRIALVTAVYGTWLLLGVALAAATVLCGEARPARGPRGGRESAGRGTE